jgi:hypothetical protein
MAQKDKASQQHRRWLRYATTSITHIEFDSVAGNLGNRRGADELEFNSNDASQLLPVAGVVDPTLNEQK